jgi:hypothetical protein
MTDSRFPQILEATEWNLVQRGNLNSSVGTDNLFLPIPPQEIEIINSRLLAVGVATVQARSTWKFGGRASQSYELPFEYTSNFRRLPVLIETKPLRLHCMNLLAFERKLPTYTLVIDFPSWFRDVEYEVWKYDGQDSDLYEQIANLSGN